MSEPDDVILLHRDGLIFSVDDQTASMFGYLATELIGMPLTTVIDQEAGRDDNGKTPCPHQAIGIRKDGSRFLLDVLSGCSCGTGQRERGAEPLRILVVEDDENMLIYLTRFLELKGHQVHGAKDMRSALQMARATEFDLLLSDIRLPDGTGWDLLRELRAGARPIRAIAISGLGAPEDLERSESAGFSEHLVKPVAPERLEEAVRKGAKAA